MKKNLHPDQLLYLFPCLFFTFSSLFISLENHKWIEGFSLVSFFLLNAALLFFAYKTFKSV